MSRTRKYQPRVLARLIIGDGEEQIVSCETTYSRVVDGEEQTVVVVHSNLGVHSEANAVGAKKLCTLIFTISAGETQGRRMQGGH